MFDTADDPTKPPPPIGDPKHAERYINQLIELLKLDKVTLTHSDLKKYDPSSMQDHYRISLGQYDAEVSHSINPNTGQDVYLLLFTNVSQIKAGQADQAILSYLYLSEPIFNHFKSAAINYFDRQHQQAESKRFEEVMQPIDNLIDQTLADSN